MTSAVVRDVIIAESSLLNDPKHSMTSSDLPFGFMTSFRGLASRSAWRCWWRNRSRRSFSFFLPRHKHRFCCKYQKKWKFLWKSRWWRHLWISDVVEKFCTRHYTFDDVIIIDNNQHVDIWRHKTLKNALKKWWRHLYTNDVTHTLMTSLIHRWRHLHTDDVTYKLMTSLTHWWRHSHVNYQMICI